MMLSWCFSRDLIENSPSRRDGISADVEEQARSRYCSFIRWLSAQFKLDAIPIATALMFCHRFYSQQSLARNDWKTIATTCVFLAAKSEDSYRALDDVVKIAFADDVQKLPDNSQRKEFLQRKRDLIEMAERVVLTTLRFDTTVNHPYRPLHNAMKKIGMNLKEPRKEVWKLVACCLDTTLCLQYNPECIAAASLFVLAKLFDLKLPDVRGLSIWSEKFVPEQCDACIRDMVQILCMRQWPNCARLMDKPALPQPEPEQEPEPKPKQVTSIQKLPKPEEAPNDNKPKLNTPESVLDLAEAASKEQEAVPKRDPVVLDSSSLSKDVPVHKAPETKLEGLCNGLDKAYVARIQEAIRKRKSTAVIRPTVGNAQLDASSEGSDDWIERELESGIIVGSKPVCHNKMKDTAERVASEDDDWWIEKELEEGIIMDSKPVRNNKMKNTASLKVEKCGASKAWWGQKRKIEAGVDLSSKRQRH